MELKIESTGDQFKMHCDGTGFEILNGLIYGTATVYLNYIDRTYVSFEQFMDVFAHQLADCINAVEGAGGNGNNKT